MTARDRIKLFCAYRRLHLQASGYFPVDWMTTLDATGEPPHANPYYRDAMIDEALKATRARCEAIGAPPPTDDDMLAALGTWTWNISTGTNNLNDLVNRIVRSEDGYKNANLYLAEQMNQLVQRIVNHRYRAYFPDKPS